MVAAGAAKVKVACFWIGSTIQGTQFMIYGVQRIIGAKR
jgi:hypothetical protein